MKKAIVGVGETGQLCVVFMSSVWADNLTHALLTVVATCCLSSKCQKYNKGIKLSWFEVGGLI